MRKKERDIKQMDYVKEMFPFSNTERCPEWAKVILSQKYQLRHGSVTKILTHMALHGAHGK